MSQPIRHCPICNYSSSDQILRHLRGKHSDAFKHKDSAVIISKVQSALSNKGTKLKRMEEMKDIFGRHWQNPKMRKTAYK